MGNFKGLLICSDIDGTFAGNGIEEVNREAAKYFIKNGGKFCFSTGRPVNYLKNMSFFDAINAPCCLFNGAIVYDYQREEIIFEKRLDYNVSEFLSTVDGFRDKMTFLCIYDNISDDGIICSDISCLSDEQKSIVPLKLVCCFGDERHADEFKRKAMECKLFKDTSYISKSWDTGVEFNSLNATKGDAFKFIKSYLGETEKAYGIGDYENDEPLLKMADVGVAVGNALDSVKAVSDKQVKPCLQGALADLIEKIENGEM